MRCHYKTITQFRGTEKENMPVFRLVLITLVVLIAGCSQKKELTFHVGGTAAELAYWEKIVAEYNTATGSSVSLIRTTTQTEQRKQSLLISLRGKKADPDIMLMDVAWIGQMAHSNWLEPLDTSEIDYTRFFSRILKLADRYQGKLIGVPLNVDGGVLYYRKDLLNTYGYETPPKTWHELRSMALKIMPQERKKNKDFWGFAWQGAQYEGLVCNALEFFASAGGGFISTNKGIEAIIDKEENIKAAAFMADLISGSKISPPNTYTDMKEEEVRLLFQNGNALFERNWPYAWALHSGDDSAVKGSFGVAPLPHFAGGKSASTLGGWHLGISAFSDDKKGAMAFLKYIVSYDVQKKLALHLGYNPGRVDVYEDAELLEKYPVLPQLQAAFENAIPRPALPYYSEISLVLQKYINSVLSGKIDARTALTNAQNEVEKIIKTYETD